MNDQQLIDAMTALKYRISSDGAGINYRIPIPGHRGNTGFLKWIGLPEKKTIDQTVPSALSEFGVNVDVTDGLIAGFEINEDEQVAPINSLRMQEIHDHATYDGTIKLWKLTKKHRPVFIDSVSDIRAMLTMIRQYDFINSGGSNRSASQQLIFLQQTLQQARQQLAMDDSKVAQLQLELKLLQNSQIHTRQLQQDVRMDENLRTIADRQLRIDHGKEALKSILKDPVTHVAAIQILIKSLPSSKNQHFGQSSYRLSHSKTTPSILSNLRPTHGNFDNIADVLIGTPAFAQSFHDLSTSIEERQQQKMEEQEYFTGIESLAANNMDQIFTHYVVTVVSEGGRRMEVNLSHNSRGTSGDGMTFEQLRDQCSKYWGLVEHKFMIQTDYSMPVEEHASVRDHLQHLAVSERIMWGKGEKPFLLDARETFKQIDEDNSGQIDVGEFAKLFKRFSTTAQSKIVSVFAEIDVDRSGEITFAEFALEWGRVLNFLKSDIPRNELPVCYLLPKEAISGGGGEGDYSSMLGGSTVGFSNNVTGADKHIIESGRDVGNIDIDNNKEDMRNSPVVGFEMFDASKDGTISFEEFKDIFANINSLEMNDTEVRRELRELFNNTNKSRTGLIDFGEFSKNWKSILTKMADHSRVFTENEILQELAQNLGNSRIEVFERKTVRLPMRESMMIREAFVYVVLVILLTICTFENRDILRSHYMIHKFRLHTFDESFGGPLDGVGSSWNGNKHYDTNVHYHWDAMNQSWLPGTAPVPIGGKITEAREAAAAAAVAAAKAPANNASSSSSSASSKTDGTATSTSATLVEQIRPQSFAYYESIVPDNTNALDSIEINKYLHRQWNFDIDGTMNRIATNAWRSNVIKSKQEYIAKLMKLNYTWYSMREKNTLNQEEEDWLKETEKVLKLEISGVNTISDSRNDNRNLLKGKSLNYRGVTQSYPDSLLYPNKDQTWVARVKAGKLLNSLKTSIASKIVPDFLSSLDEVYNFLKGPLRRAIVAVRADEAKTMRETYMGSSFWGSGSTTTTDGDKGNSRSGDTAVSSTTSTISSQSHLHGRPTPYDDEDVVGRTDIFNNSYVNLVARPVGPGLVLEKRSYIDEHECGSKEKTKQRVGHLLCQPKISNEWEQAPSSIITADVTDTYNKYKNAIAKLRKINWLHSRKTAEVKMSGLLYNPNSNLAMSWIIHIKRPTSAGSIFEFHEVNLRVIQIDQLNTPIQRSVGILSIFVLILLGYVAKVEIDQCQRIKLISGHYRVAMRSLSLWGSVIMILFFIVHLILRAVYFFNDYRRNFDITTKNLATGLPNLSFLEIFELEHLSLTIVSAIGWFRMLNYLMLSSRIW
jgi:Ca2+-binding EF-hand superfamily protein